MTVALSPDLVAQADSFLVDFDTRANPWEFFQRLRETAPVLRTSSGTWLISTYADCQSVLKDDRLSRREAALRTSALPAGDAADQYTTRLVCEDGANHRRLRRIVNLPFAPRNIARWTPRIMSVAEDVLARRRQPRSMDFLEEFSYPLPIRVLCELLGVPHEDHARMGVWMSVLLEHINETASEEFTKQKMDAMVGLSAYLRDLVAERRAGAPQDDLMSAMIATEAEGDRLSERELIGILAELLHAGFESTANMMADGLHCLLEHPEQQRLLAEQPQLAESAVEEMLRFATPVLHALPRVALEDITLPSGGTVAQGVLVLALVASAARDPEYVQRPDEFDITRQDNPHIGFGLGEHYCLGASLARGEAVSTFRLLAQEMLATMRIDGPIAWKDHHIVRGLEALPIAW
ncbi:MAG: cytochrome [Pseudonocardiales bacterium]|nr:cytochrome [Pseudonocardiales bacterium]